MQDLLALKQELEKPGVGIYRHNLAESFRGKKHVPMKWIREWIKTDWHTFGCKYLWLAAMNACIGRPNIPVNIIYQGLLKPDPDTFNAAIEACKGSKIKFGVISWWYDSCNPIFRIAAMTACVDKFWIPLWFIEHGTKDSDIRVRRIAEDLLVKMKSLNTS